MPRLPPSQNLETLREFGLKLVRRNVWLASLSRKREKVKHMKNIIIGILVVVSVALGGLLIQKDKQMSLAEAKFKETQQSLAELQSSVTQREQQEVKLRENLEKAQVESAANAGTAAQLSIALTNRVAAEEKTNAKPANPFAEMFKNPEMRDMIREQQKTVFATMVEKNFAEFIKSQQLSPEQATALKDLIAKKMAAGADVGMEMMGGELTTEQRAELIKKAKASGDAVAAEIKEFLGADAYAAYEGYEKTLPDRMAISTFRDQLSGGDLALNADQEQQLIQAMTEERQGFKFTTDFSQQNDFSQDLFDKFTEENTSRFLQEQEQLNQKYLSRAQGLLSAGQYTAYEKSLKAQQEMMKMGMKMAASMFGNGAK
jgi:uncharacterized protein YxeA